MGDSSRSQLIADLERLLKQLDTRRDALVDTLAQVDKIQEALWTTTSLGAIADGLAAVNDIRETADCIGIVSGLGSPVSITATGIHPLSERSGDI